MAQNGLLDLISESYQRNVGRPFAQLAGNGMRGLLGLELAEYADNSGREAYRTGQALSNTPTPLALAALPAAVVKGAKAAKAAKDAAPRAEALRRAAEQGYRTEWHMGFSGPAYDAVDVAKRGSITNTPAAKIATFLTDSASDAADFANNAAKTTGQKPNVMNVGVASDKMTTLVWKDSYPPIRSEGGQRMLAGALQDIRDAGFDAVRILNANDSISGNSKANTLAVFNTGIMRNMDEANFAEKFKGKNGLLLGLSGIGVGGLLQSGQDQP